VRQILYVAPDEAKIEIVTRETDDSWRSVFVTGLDAVLPLESLGLGLPMAEVYAEIAFAEKAAETG
jgi:hypothetical protein